MIYKNKNFMITTFQIIMLNFNYFNNSKKLVIIGFVLNFCKNHFSKKEDY